MAHIRVNRLSTKGLLCGAFQCVCVLIVVYKYIKMSEFQAPAVLDMNELDIRKATTPELIIVNQRAYEATTSIGMHYLRFHNYMYINTF